MTSFPIRLLLLLTGVAIGSAAYAQTPGTPSATIIAIPPLTTPDTGAKGNQTLSLAWQATELIAADLRGTAELMPLQPNQKDYYSYPEVTAPSFPKWRAAGAKALVTGFLQSRSDGRLTFGCYVYDLEKGRELGRKGFVVAQSEWRRAAHKCSGLAYQAVTGAPGLFDTRIAYVAESGVGDARLKRIAVMDSDGSSHSYVTMGETMVMTPRISPRGNRVAFVSYTGGKPQIRIAELGTSEQRPLVTTDAMSFAPRYSPDGSRIVFSMMLGANSDIYVVNADGGLPQRLTTSPGIDTAPSFSPDGSKIVFESDRSGSQQLYVMNSDGSDQRRISFGGGAFASPVWNPRSDLIAFTRIGGGGFRIGTMSSSGGNVRLLTNAWQDEGPSWAPNGQFVMFNRIARGSGASSLYAVHIDGGTARRLPTPLGGSDPSWSPLNN